MKRFLILCLFLLPVSVFTQTKTTAAVDEWAEVPANAVREGATVTLTGDFAVTLHIYMVLSSEVATTNGPSISIQSSGNTTGDEDWTEKRRFQGPIGTANSEAVSGTEAIGSTIIEVASTTGLYDDDGTRLIFFENTSVADSEIGWLVSHEGTPSITVLDGITNAQTSSTLFDIVQSWEVAIDFPAVRIRVLYDNTEDVSGPTIHTYCRVARVEAL